MLRDEIAQWEQDRIALLVRTLQHVGKIDRRLKHARATLLTLGKKR